MASAAVLGLVVAAVMAVTPAMVSAGASGDEDSLRALALTMPVAGVEPSSLRDNYLEGRAGHPHAALDIAAARGTPVRAVADGRLVKLFTSRAGGLTVYQLDTQQRFFFYYAHLDHYAAGLHEGMALHRCDLIGYVGTTGNALPDAPHLHFAVFVADPQKRWWQGTAINPFAAFAASASPGC